MLRDDLRAYSIESAARIASVSPRQLTYWAETGLVGPSVDRKVGNRRIRLWGFQDLLEVCVVVQLVGRGVTLQQVRKVVDFIRARDGYDRPLSRVVFMVDRNSGEIAWVSIDGNIEGAKRPSQLVMRQTVDLEEIRRSIRSHRLRKDEETGSIESRRGVMGSKPVFAGTRTPVETLAPYLERGYSTERILESFPHLDPADVDAARYHLSVA